MTATRGFLLAIVLGACSSPDAAAPEIVVANATMGAGTPTLVGATGSEVYWRAGSTAIAGSSLDALPASGEMLGSTTGRVVHAGDHILLATPDQILTARIGQPAAKLLTATADTLAQGPVDDPLLAWSTGTMVSYGLVDKQTVATIPKITAVDALAISPHGVYVAGHGTSGDRLVRLDRRSGDLSTGTTTATSAALFPDGAPDGATYTGRLVGADDDGALWLVTEKPTGRAILVSVPDTGTPALLLSHMSNPSAFFVTPDAFYWQESDALLTAPRTGGSASIAAHVSNAGAVADGYVYYVDGDAIMRAPVD